MPASANVLSGSFRSNPQDKVSAYPSRRISLPWLRQIAGELAIAACVLTSAAAGWLVVAVLPVFKLGSAQLGHALQALAPLILLLLILLSASGSAGERLTRAQRCDAMLLRTLIAYAAALLVLCALVGLPSEPAFLLAWISSGSLGAVLAASLTSVLLKSTTIGGSLRRRIAIFGGSRRSRMFFQSLNEKSNINFAGLFDDRNASDRVRCYGIDVAGGLHALIESAKTREIDEIAIDLPLSATARINHLVEKLRPYPVEVNLITRASTEFSAGELFGTLNGSLNAYSIPLLSPRITGWKALIKQLIDSTIAGLALILAAPIFAIIALAIKLDSTGPVFFRQKRNGICGELIVVWKFRTMRVLEDGSAIRQASKSDPRVTRVGRLLRKTSLDEIPQLINVLLGTMSLVGPRPHATAHNEQYGSIIDPYHCRHRVKPGITGWAQINGFRGETIDVAMMRSRVEHDLWYIANWSPWLDLKILLLTPIYGFVHRNAF